jgi:UDP-hydrolysing UDP-N-acetyl-D-glucosamine 2-epimerase
MSRPMSNRRRIAVVTGSRADYGLLRGLLMILRQASDIELQVIACGMHLSEQFGHTVRNIENDGFAIAAKIDLALTGDSPSAIAQSTAVGLSGFAAALPKLRPDLVLLLGDRFEILAAATASTLLGIPIGHIHGGEVTTGAFDDAIRHAITKMACLHFVAADAYRQRVVQMGESPLFVFNVGAPGLDQATIATSKTRAEVLRDLTIDDHRRYLLVTLHPTTARADKDDATAIAMLNALATVDECALVFTGVNADPGHRVIDHAIRRFVDRYPDRARLFASLGSERYWMALHYAEAVVGNSSSGILEAPAVGIPSVNIGDRQLGRLRANSIIDCDIDEQEIASAIRSILSGNFHPDSSVPPPYGSGGASRRIADIVRRVDIGSAFPKPAFFDLPGIPE